jgi:hypothetical protein
LLQPVRTGPAVASSKATRRRRTDGFIVKA